MTSFIGREKELKDLGSHLENAKTGKGSTIFISGEAGIGSGGIFNGAMILLAFALSASVLMIAITLLVAGFEMAVMQKLKAATPYIKKASGIILIAVGIYLLYYYWTVARFI
jgi:sulfite exporter TauE/SafE